LQRRGREMRHTADAGHMTTSIQTSDFSINREDLPTAWNFLCVGRKA
jgi:hypothetical protein